MRIETIGDQQQRHLRNARVARRVMWGGIATQWISAFMCAVSGHLLLAGLFLLAALAFVAFDALFLGPFMHDVTSEVEAAERYEDALDAAFPGRRRTP